MQQVRWVVLGLSIGVAVAFLGALLRPRRRKASVTRRAASADSTAGQAVGTQG